MGEIVKKDTRGVDYGSYATCLRRMKDLQT